MQVPSLPQLALAGILALAVLAIAKPIVTPTTPRRPTPTVNGEIEYTTFLIPITVPDFKGTARGGMITFTITATAPLATGPLLPPGMIIPLTEAPTPAVEKRQPAPTAFVNGG